MGGFHFVTLSAAVFHAPHIDAQKVAVEFQKIKCYGQVDCGNCANEWKKVQILREYTRIVSKGIIIAKGVRKMKEEYLIQEINYILRRNYSIGFLRKALTRILLLEKLQTK